MSWRRIDRGIFPLLFVADFGVTHESAHVRGRAGDRVAEEIDSYHSILSMVRRPIRRGTMVAPTQTPTTVECRQNELRCNHDRLSRVVLDSEIRRHRNCFDRDDQRQ